MEKDIGKIKKNDVTDIIIRIDDFGGKKGLTIREHLTSERYTGFTKSGTRIPAESFLDFKKLINAIDEDELTSPVSEKQTEADIIEEGTSEEIEEKQTKPKPKKHKIKEELY